MSEEKKKKDEAGNGEEKVETGTAFQFDHSDGGDDIETPKVSDTLPSRPKGQTRVEIIRENIKNIHWFVWVCVVALVLIVWVSGLLWGRQSAEPEIEVQQIVVTEAIITATASRTPLPTSTPLPTNTELAPTITITPSETQTPNETATFEIIEATYNVLNAEDATPTQETLREQFDPTRVLSETPGFTIVSTAVPTVIPTNIVPSEEPMQVPTENNRFQVVSTPEG